MIENEKMMDSFDNKYEKKNPFTVPEGYFEAFDDKMINRIDKLQKAKRIGFLQIIKPYIGLVGIFLMSLLIVQLVFPLLVDDSKMLLKQGDQIVQTQDAAKQEEIILDQSFNPTSEEIIEYLASEVNGYEFFYAELY